MSKPGEPRDKLTKEQRAEVLRLYCEGVGYEILAAQFEITDSAVWGVASRAGVARNRRDVTEEDRSRAELLCSAERNAVRRIVTHPLPTLHGSAKHVDQSAFDVVTPENAYWLGLLMSDGAIVKGKYPQLVLQLTDPDQYQIHAFRSFLKSEHAVTYIEAGITSQGLNRRPAARIAIKNTRLLTALNEYGINCLKTCNSQAVHVQQHPDFWRGCVDGDGCILKDGVSLIGSVNLIAQFKDFCTFLYPKTNMRVFQRGNIWLGEMHGKSASIALRSMYDTKGPVLARKAEQARKVYERHYGT